MKRWNCPLDVSHPLTVDRVGTPNSWCISCSTSAVQSVDLAADAVDLVNHPPHYTSHPSGVECIEIVEHFGFCLGNAIKYLWRAGLKGDEIEDLKKSVWYINREIARREAAK